MSLGFTHTYYAFLLSICDLYYYYSMVLDLPLNNSTSCWVPILVVYSGLYSAKIHLKFSSGIFMHSFDSYSDAYVIM